MKSTTITVDTPFDCGWWPPGEGEPGESWVFEHSALELHYDGGESIDVLLATPDGPRALASVPLSGLARLMLEAHQ